jgi:hypothetical protein
MSQPRAQIVMRDGLHYRRTAFEEGLTKTGYRVKIDVLDPTKEDVLVIWNRAHRGAEEAYRFEHVGARVLVAENGYLGKNWLGGNWYALSLGHHAGTGEWVVGDHARWDGLNVELAQWRVGGTETVILGQRGIGEYQVQSPDCWAENCQKRFGGRIRPHPGKDHDAATPLEKDLENAAQVITWASSAALRALLMGVPVWYELPRWIGAEAANHVTDLGLLPPKRDDAARLSMFRKLIWAQWQLDEIQSGAAFRHLLQAI